MILDCYRHHVKTTVQEIFENVFLIFSNRRQNSQTSGPYGHISKLLKIPVKAIVEVSIVRVVGAPEFVSRGPGFESRCRRNSAHGCSELHCIDLFIISLLPSRYGLNIGETGIMHQIVNYLGPVVQN